MKAFIVVGILLLGISSQAMSMGHPHNMFAARKQLRAKASASADTHKSSTSFNWQSTGQAAKSVLMDRLAAVLTQLRPAKSF